MSYIVKTETFVLNLNKATADSYATWITIRLRSNGVLERLSNEGGNGQTWELFGYGMTVDSETVNLFTTTDSEKKAARIFAHCVKRIGVACNVNGFGMAWHKAEILATGAKGRNGRLLTAATSLREGKVTRDKNKKAKRWTGSLADMIAQRDMNAKRIKHAAKLGKEVK